MTGAVLLPVSAENFKISLREQSVAIFAVLAMVYKNTHLFAVNILNAQASQFRYAQSSAINSLKYCFVPQAVDCGKEAYNFRFS